MILIGDIGGTRARFATIDAARKTHALGTVRELPSREFPTLEAALKKYMNDTGLTSVSRAILAVAGPVEAGVCNATNLPWEVHEKKVARVARAVSGARLLNDLVALGLGALGTAPKHLVALHLGLPKRRGGTIGVLAAGTGLGQSTLVWDGTRHVVCASEGGHADFAPETKDEWALATFLAKKYGHVSYERIASGSAVPDVYRFFAGHRRERSEVAKAFLAAKDPTAAIVQAGLKKKTRASRETVETIARVIGRQAGNVALGSFATGGVFIGGGFAGRLLPVLRGRMFRDAFIGKGRLRPLLERIPVALATEGGLGLAGCAYYARHLA